MKAEARALSTLVGVAQGDFRGCLNTLQARISDRFQSPASSRGPFRQILKAREKDVTETAVRHATQGMKEAEASHMIVLSDLFLPLSKKRAKEMGVSEDEPKYVSRLSREAENCGSIDKVALGSFTSHLLDGPLSLMLDGRMFRTLRAAASPRRDVRAVFEGHGVALSIRHHVRRNALRARVRHDAVPRIPPRRLLSFVSRARRAESGAAQSGLGGAFRLAIAAVRMWLMFLPALHEDEDERGDLQEPREVSTHCRRSAWW